MTGFTSFLPSYDASPEENAQYLRQTLPLMMKNNVSADPINYAIWYEYVSGSNAQLKKELDELLNLNQQITTEQSVELYKKHVCNASIESFEKINKELQKILNDTTQSVGLASDKVSMAEASFNHSAHELETAKSNDDIKSVLSQVLTETKLLAETSQILKSKLDEANEEMDQMRKELTLVREVAVTDALTGLLNRRAFDDILSDLVEETSAQKNFCLAILDLDHFKKINDTFGHLTGDKVLRYTAGIMKRKVSENHYDARYGGEEMAVIMPETDLQEAILVVENIRSTLEKNRLKRKGDGESIGKVTLSAGVASYKAGEVVDSLIERADQSLYQAKTNGRNQVVAL
jgi:diguanylate cyclase